ncbi:serpentine type 7TM GPCR receptor class ab chemoreceptor domain-containing protein [Ditylenchus destructor]|nr:serpentine type 7TM GPCR receptor class ab chemoreceptor domain-containing protein [Ditylenchus destructor]
MIPLAFERIIATIRAKRYEKETVPYFGVAASLIVLAVGYGFSTYISYQITHGKLVDKKVVYPHEEFRQFMVAFASVMFFVTIIVFMVLITLFYYNRRCYSFTQMANKHSIQQRYQYSENIRTSGQLFSITIVTFVCNTFMSAITVISFNNPSYNPMYKQLFGFANALGNTTIPLCAIVFHPTLRRLALKYIYKCGYPIQRRVKPKYPTEERAYERAPKSLITGKSLIIGRSKQRELYLEHLRKAWS